jgi:cytochrome c biogenesis protein CcdA/glutaredoxin
VAADHKKLLLILLLILMASAVFTHPTMAAPQANQTTTPQCIYFFYANGCSACEEAKTYMLQVEQQFPNLTVTDFEITNSSNYDLMVQYYNCHNITSPSWPVVFIGTQTLVGVDQIESELTPLLLNDTGVQCPTCNSTPSKPVGPPPLGIIFGMAFADSLNPCAITVLIVLLVALSAASRSVWKTGFAYILGNFLSYLAIGFGLFTILQQFNLPTYTTKVVGVLAIGLAFVSLFIKLPDRSKPTIKRLIDTATSPYFAFLVGVGISAIELPCTGGPYFLALTLLTQYGITGLGILGYLLLYNLIFVLPLVVVLLVYRFAKSPNIPKQYIRIVSAVLMLIMGIWLLLL